MSIEYKVSQDGLLIEASPKGVLDTKKTVDYFGRLQVDNRIKSGAIEIVNLNNVTDFKFSSSESELITEKYQIPKEYKTINATIFFCEEDVTYGMGRMLQTYHEFANPNHNVYIVRSAPELEDMIKKIKRSDKSEQ